MEQGGSKEGKGKGLLSGVMLTATQLERLPFLSTQFVQHRGSIAHSNQTNKQKKKLSTQCDQHRGSIAHSNQTNKQKKNSQHSVISIVDQSHTAIKQTNKKKTLNTV